MKKFFNVKYVMHVVITVLEIFHSGPTFYILCVNDDILLSEM
jgi:hypothetical protein